MRQIASLSAYIKVYYEFPFLQNGDSAWETFNCLLSNISIDKKQKSSLMKRYNGEYSILALISLIIFLLNAVTTFFFICDEMYLEKSMLIGWLVLYIITTIFMIILIGVIHHASCARVNLMDMTIWYTAGYIEEAKRRGLISESDYGEIYQVLRPNDKIAEKEIEDKVEKEWKYEFNYIMRKSLR